MGSTRHHPMYRRARLQLEQLEDRLVLSAALPTALAQQFLMELNAARANPAAYGQSIGVDLSNVAPSQPLAFDPSLIAAALGHSQDMNNNNYFAHTSPNGEGPAQRITDQGYAWTSVGESIAAGYTTTESALSGLIADFGIADLGHRYQLLSIGQVYQTQSAVGIGIVLNGSGIYQDYYTIDSAAPQNNLPFLTGVVFTDQAGTGQYAVGEGLGGVTITVQGVGSTTTWATGGYSIQVNPGTYSVTASGGALATPFTRVVTIGGQNVQLNVVQSSQAALQANTAFVNQLFQTMLQRQPTATELNTDTTNLGNGTITQASLTAQVRASQEYQQVCTVWLKQLGRDLLGRQLASNEVASWLGWLQSTGTKQGVATAFLNSQLYQTQVWSGWVQQAYQTYLGRTAVAAEVSFWLPYFQAGWTKSNLVYMIVVSPTYQTRVGASNTQFVTALYRDMLGMTPTTQNIATWANALAGGTSRNSVVAIFLGCSLYQTHEYTLGSNALYQNFLGRPPSNAELASLLTALQSGMPYQTIAIALLCSQGYYTRALQNS